MGIRATIDGVEVPVERGEIPAVSFSVLDLEEPDKIKGSQSTSFKMPATREVRRALGGPGMSESVTSPRPRLRIGNGGQVLYESKVIPVERSVEQYSVVAVGDNAEWFDLAKSTKMRSLDMGATETITDTVQRDSWVDDELPICYPLIDFGSFEGRGTSYNVTVNKLRPAIRPHVFLRAAFASWGFSLKPMGSLGTLWKKFCIPNTYGTIPISDSYRENASAIFSETSSPAYSTIGSYQEFRFDTAVFDPSGTYASPGRYVPPFTQTTQVTFNYDLMATIPSGGGVLVLPVLPVRFQLYDFAHSIVLAQNELVFSHGNTHQTGVMDFGAFNISQADQIGLRIYLNPFAPTFSSVRVISANIHYQVTGLEYQEGVSIDIAGQAPDMTLMEVLKGIAGNRCLIFRTNAAHGEVQVWYDDEFYRGTQDGIDWTDRINHETKPIKQEPIYTRRIEYRWKEDNDDRGLLDLADVVEYPGYGNHDVEMEGGVDDPMRIELPFAPTAMEWLFGGFAWAPVMREEGGTYQEDSYNRETRLLIMDGVREASWTFDGVSETTGPNCYFINNVGRYTLAFGSGMVYGDLQPGTAQVQWVGRQRRMRSPTLKADVMIHPDEVWNLDQGIPRLFSDGYDRIWMYVQKVTQYRFDEVGYTECTLIPM